MFLLRPHLPMPVRQEVVMEEKRIESDVEREGKAEVSDEAEVDVEREVDVQTGGVSIEAEREEEAEPKEG